VGQSVAVAGIEQDIASSLMDPANGAGYLIVTHPDLIDLSPGSQLDQFIGMREAEGLPVLVALVDDIYDEFSDSLPDPAAIRNFLAHAFTTWTGWDADGDLAPDPPRYVLFLGDASVDYHGRFDYGTAPQPFFNDVPTAIIYHRSAFVSWFSSDNWMASVAGSDRMPDYLLGRLSTRSVGETEAVLAKIRTYETPTPHAAWKSHALFLTDRGNYQAETDEFETIAAQLEAMAAPSFTTESVYYDRDFGGTDWDGMNQAILDEISAGAGIVNYVGHGAFDIWGLDIIFLGSDVLDLTNGDKQPLVLIENCLSGGFSWHYRPALSEALTQDDPDGAIATFAPASLSSNLFSEPVGKALFGAIMGPDRERRVGVATAAGMGALAGMGNTTELMGYQLIGDPATRLALPAPAPPTDPAAVPGNTVVHLSWTASPDPVVGYHVYRTEHLFFPYTRVTGAPVAATAYDDTTVQNAVNYLYAIVAVDAEGFESAFSNQNTDCGAAGPDCVQATPFNDVPPTAPVGVAASNPGSGTRITVSWTPNPEPDIALYRVHYGDQSGVYTLTKEVGGGATEVTVNNLQDGILFYFAVEAENFDELVGPLSDEVTATPILLPGLRPPAPVSGLQVTIPPAEPTALDLSWDPVTTDIYGGTTTVTSYEVYRGLAADFVPVIGVPQGVVAAPATVYRDPGAAATPDGYHYLVAAVDAAGNRSGIGADLPMGISDLTLTLQGDGETVALSWPAVSLSVSGGPTIVSEYRIHGAVLPVSRTEASGVNLLGTTTGTSFQHLPGAAQIRYYTVLVVDNRGSMSPF